MVSNFTTNISPYVKAELKQYRIAMKNGEVDLAFSHLESAHVLGQHSTYWHVKVHCLMLLWGVRAVSPKECLGQLLRIAGALTKTAIGLVPSGNTGGTNISPFKRLPLSPRHAEVIEKARTAK